MSKITVDRKFRQSHPIDMERPLESAIDEEFRLASTNVRSGCICRNSGRPINGQIYINPCCKVHYAELEVSALIATSDEEICQEELDAWKRRERIKKRVCYPKMTVAK